LGKAIKLREGTDVTLIAYGLMVSAALEAADTLAADGVSARVLDMATVKPLDEAAVLAAAMETGHIVVAEEHLAHGGLGSLVAVTLAELRPVPMAFVNIGDRYGQSGTPEELLVHYGLTSSNIAAAATGLMAFVP
jgi:transketolase